MNFADKKALSVIVPFYNSEKHLPDCISSIIKQDCELEFEIIMVDDCSTDKSIDIIRGFDNSNIKIFSLPKNSGPAAARNLGLEKAIGDYIFFVDADDRIAKNTLSLLYGIACKRNVDLVFCDSKWIENNKNQRKNIFSFQKDLVLSKSCLTKMMKNRIYNPLYLSGPLSFKGKLIKKSIIFKNKIIFEEQLRYLEDEIFIWDVLAFVETAHYLRKQLYYYYVHPSINTTVAKSLNNGFPICKFKIIKNHIQNSFFQRGCSKQDVKKFGEQAFIYFIINVLISQSKSILLGKINPINGIRGRRKIISDLLNEPEVSRSLDKYSRSPKESFWIIFALRFKLPKLLEFFCTLRAKKIIKLRQAVEKN